VAFTACVDFSFLFFTEFTELTDEDISQNVRLKGCVCKTWKACKNCDNALSYYTYVDVACKGNKAQQCL
jgi:hypothetical protein